LIWGVGIVGCGGAAYEVSKALDAISGAKVVAAFDRKRAKRL
jgi:predicted dehydrogenase